MRRARSHAALLIGLLHSVGRATSACEPFCDKKTQPWQQKCSWVGCSGCSECSVLLPQCKAYCGEKTQPWEERCKWNGCGACSECPECKPFCARKTDGWEELCTWDGCMGCSECAIPVVPELHCRPFCARKTDGWEELCNWGGCSGCTECGHIFCKPFCGKKTQSWPQKCGWGGCGGCMECSESPAAPPPAAPFLTTTFLRLEAETTEFNALNYTYLEYSQAVWEASGANNDSLFREIGLYQLDWFELNATTNYTREALTEIVRSSGECVADAGCEVAFANIEMLSPPFPPASAPAPRPSTPPGRRLSDLCGLGYVTVTVSAAYTFWTHVQVCGYGTTTAIVIIQNICCALPSYWQQTICGSSWYNAYASTCYAARRRLAEGTGGRETNIVAKVDGSRVGELLNETALLKEAPTRDEEGNPTEPSDQISNIAVANADGSCLPADTVKTSLFAKTLQRGKGVELKTEADECFVPSADVVNEIKPAVSTGGVVNLSALAANFVDWREWLVAQQQQRDATSVPIVIQRFTPPPPSPAPPPPGTVGLSPPPPPGGAILVGKG